MNLHQTREPTAPKESLKYIFDSKGIGL